MLLYLFSFNKQLELVIFDQETGEEYKRERVDPGDELVIEWEHSVEKTTWQEKLLIESNATFMLTETRFRSFGAGVPNGKNGSVTFEDGYVVMSELEERKQRYLWIHSQKAKFTIIKNEKNFLLPDEIPHHHKVEMIIEKG